MNICKSTTTVLVSTLLLCASLASQIRMVPDGAALRVVGGAPGHTVAILAGLEKIHAPLPGGAVLRVNPLLILAIAKFDADGEYRFEFKAASDVRVPPLRAIAQAVTIDLETNAFATTGLAEISHDGHGNYDTRDCAMIMNPHWVPPSQRTPSHRAMRARWVA